MLGESLVEWHKYMQRRDDDFKNPRFKVGDTVEVIYSYGRHQSHKGPIIEQQWDKGLFNLGIGWKYKLQKCDRFFRGNQLKRIIGIEDKREQMHRFIDALPGEAVFNVMQRLEEWYGK